MALSESSGPSPDLEALFEQVLIRRENDPTAEIGDLIESAGEQGSELRETIRLYEAIRRTSDLVRSPSTAEELDDDSKTLMEGLDGYRDLERIGRGGQAQVYKAYDEVVCRDVALKFLRLERVAAKDVDPLLQAEVQALGRLKKSCAVTVHSLATSGDRTYMVMEYVLAPTLREVIDALAGKSVDAEDPRPDVLERNALLEQSVEALTPLPARVRFISKLADAIEYCHAQGVLHRDIKPENILVAFDEGEFVPRLVDFGLSFSDAREENSLGLSERFMVTLAYSAPEQLSSEKLGSSAKAEQFSLATVAYELLTSQHPFEGQGDQRKVLEHTKKNVLAASPQPMRRFVPEMPADLEAVVAHAHEKDPEDRYARIGDLAKDLNALLDFRSISIHRPTAWGESKRFLRRNRARLLRWAVGVLFVLSVPASYYLYDSNHQRSQLRTQLEEFPESAVPWNTANEFKQGWTEFGKLADRADELNEKVVASLLLGKIASAREAAGDELSFHMHDVIQIHYRSRNRFPDESLFIKQEVATIWSAALELERTFNPTQTINDSIRENLPKRPTELDRYAESQLWRHVGRPNNFCSTELSARDFSEALSPGVYRVMMWLNVGDPVPAIEAEFSLPLTQFPEFNLFDSKRFPNLYEMPEFDETFVSTFDFEIDGVPSQAIEEKPGRIRGARFEHSSLITWRRLAEVLPPDQESWQSRFLSYLARSERERPTDDQLDIDSPARVGPLTAQRFAFAVGARLPSINELLILHTSEPGCDQSFASGIEGELSGSPEPNMRLLCYLTKPDVDQTRTLEATRLVDPTREMGQYVFRIARTLASREELENR